MVSRLRQAQQLDGAHALQRNNLLNLVKICTKTLLESHLGYGHALGDDHAPLQQVQFVYVFVLGFFLVVKKKIPPFFFFLLLLKIFKN